MKYLSSRVFWGLVLLLGGILILLENISVFKGGAIFWGIVLITVGVIFLWSYFKDKSQWWPIFPGVILVVTGILSLLSAILPKFDDLYAGLVFLGGIGVCFFIVYAVNRANWWALIPGGILLTLAIVAGLENTISGLSSGGIFFFGIGITFLLVAIAPNPEGKFKWAFIPAFVLALIGLLMLLAGEQLLAFILPVALLVVGGIVIWRSIRHQ